MRKIKKLFQLFGILIIAMFLSLSSGTEVYSNSKKSGKKSSNLTQKVKKQPSNPGKYKVFKCKNKECGRKITTTLDAYKANTIYQKGFCSGGCENATKNNKKKK